MPMTNNHQKEALSIAYIQAIAATAGFSCTRPSLDDDSIDLIISGSGAINNSVTTRSPRIELQAKATSQQILNGEFLEFNLPVKNYNDLRGDDLIVPRILVVMTIPGKVEDWLFQTDEQLQIRNCAYWISLRDAPETSNTSKVRIHIPKIQIFSVNTLNMLMTKVARREPL